MGMMVNILAIIMLFTVFITFEVWVILSAIMPELKIIKARNRAERKRLLMIADNLQGVSDKIFFGGEIGMEEELVIRDAKEELERIAR